MAKVYWDNDVEVLLEAIWRKRISRVQGSCVADGPGEVWLLGLVGFLILTGSADGSVVGVERFESEFLEVMWFEGLGSMRIVGVQNW